MTVTIMKKQKIKKLGWECSKTWVGIFQVRISGLEFSGWEFSRGEFDGWEFSGWEFSLYRLKASNKKVQIPLFINQFVSLIELKM